MTRRVFGRDSDLATINDLVDRFATGDGGVLYLHGPSGIDKSGLIEHLNGRAERRVVAVTQTVAEATRRGEPLSVFRTLLTGIDSAVDDPEIECVLGAIEALSSSRPSTLVIEDAHWADRHSLASIGAITRRAAEFGLLVAVTARDGVADLSLMDLQQRVRALSDSPAVQTG